MFCTHVSYHSTRLAQQPRESYAYNEHYTIFKEWAYGNANCWVIISSIITRASSEMEGGDNTEQFTQSEESKPEASVPDAIVEAPPEILTDSIVDDDLVVIPSQNEKIEDKIQPEKQQTEPAAAAVTVPPVSSPPAEPEIPASAPASAEPKSSISEASQSQSQSQPVIPPPQPNPVLEPAPQAQPIQPVMAAKPVKATEEDDDEDFEDETLVERLIGLTEMFPESVCRAAGLTLGLSVGGLKRLFSFSRSALWIGSTSFMVLILPIVFETEMVHMEQAQIQRQKQILLGPNAATAGAMTGAMTPPIPGVSVAPPPSEAR